MASNETFDESPLAEFDSEALDFRAASESFSARGQLKKADLQTLRLRTSHGPAPPADGGWLAALRPATGTAFPGCMDSMRSIQGHQQVGNPRFGGPRRAGLALVGAIQAVDRRICFTDFPARGNRRPGRRLRIGRLQFASRRVGTRTFTEQTILPVGGSWRKGFTAPTSVPPRISPCIYEDTHRRFMSAVAGHWLEPCVGSGGAGVFSPARHHQLRL